MGLIYLDLLPFTTYLPTYPNTQLPTYLPTYFSSYISNFHFSSLVILTYLLTYSMAQSPSWEANWFAASQEIPRISRNPKVHFRTHKRPPPVSILGQSNPVHIPTSYLLEIHPNIMHPSTPRSPPVFSFPPVSPARPHTPPFPHPYVPHALPISFFSVLSLVNTYYTVATTMK